MKVKLMYRDAEGILDATMHVNPNHIVSVSMRGDNKVGFMRLTTCVYEIDRESYDRIVEWMDKQ